MAGRGRNEGSRLEIQWSTAREVVYSSYCGFSATAVNFGISMLMHSRLSRLLCTSALFACLAAPLRAQTIDDGIMLGQHELLTGNFFSYDTWDFYTNDEFVMSDRVDMPNTLDYVASAGYMKPGGLMTSVSFSQQQTLGGGDIWRQDMPFVSNRMNSFRAGAMVMYPIPKLAPLAVHFALAQTFDGRNVGEATTVTTGLQYTFNGSSTR
jgi:hypothetical protein